MKGLIGVLLGMMLVLQNAVATPIQYGFYQGGYAGGAVVSGTFSGEDLDGDGQLSSFSGEVSDFSLLFSGAGFLPGFSLDFDDLFGLVYDLNGGVLGDGTSGDWEGILAWNWQSLFGVGPGPLGSLCGGAELCSIAASHSGALFSAEAVQVTAAVPEPSVFVLFVLGLIGLIWSRRNNKENS